MSTIPSLDSPEKLQAWKKGFRALLRRCGKQQQEVAFEMARIVRSLGSNTQDQAFISAISRFANGKDSAFPGWFYKEDTRLLPMAQAMGLSSTEEIWALLHLVSGESKEEETWHPAFPNIQIEIAIQIQGKDIKEVARTIYWRAKRSIQTCHIWIYGSKMSGRSSAIRQLSAAISKIHHDSNPNIMKDKTKVPQLPSFICIHKAEISTFDPVGHPFCYRIREWREREFSLLYQQLRPYLSLTQQKIADVFVQEVSVLLSDVYLYAYDAISMFRMILERGIPSSKKELMIWP